MRIGGRASARVAYQEGMLALEQERLEDALEELVPELIIRGSTQPGATADVHGEDM